MYNWWNYNNKFYIWDKHINFKIKIPIYLFHGSLLNAHIKALYYVSITLASIILKFEGYGILRLIIIF